ncbi:MAG: alcohol dehydrogenase [Candidatus Nephthysia bennettiae]|uniref:NADPH:quinone oxidoreductase family protein n=1 Tax=Candidatus Nephthysia bennettiae TaxID=3127016 RepID=A0A934K311_9BACT|nr:NADPH:quinone oxidoreductase family protein [Candidatus Dormibacteraeota bacterium]MBJ7614574.1 NADPH:quinone oxidoreductase family protein [Candidatus Dormibacteraeota bacterium]PZR97735.1 MAG: alcohol dehydrogenase [Candidatus Dormibacteraeota bacterium]
MKAWVVRELGGPEVLTLETFQPPPPTAGLVRIAVETAAVNFFDSLQIAGSYQVKPELPFVPGAEAAGTVVAAPADSDFNCGDRVLARLGQNGLLGGGYSELVDALPELTVRLPDEMPFDEAAGFFINYQTGWFGLMRRARLQPGEVVLVHAGAGGVGSAAIQLAKAAEARVVATAGSAQKVALCRELGADLAIDYRTEDFVEAVKAFTGGRGADVVYDPVGGDVFDRSTKCIAFEGRIVVVGFTSGRIPEARANHVLIKNYAVVGLHWGLYQKMAPRLIDEATAQLFELYAQGKIRPHISRRFPLEQAPTAIAEVTGRQSTGKVVLVTHPAESSSPRHGKR